MGQPRQTPKYLTLYFIFITSLCATACSSQSVEFSIGWSISPIPSPESAPSPATSQGSATQPTLHQAKSEDWSTSSSSTSSSISAADSTSPEELWSNKVTDFVQTFIPVFAFNKTSSTGISTGSGSYPSGDNSSGGLQSYGPLTGLRAPPPPPPSSSTNVGAIVGGVIGGVVFLALVALGLFAWTRRKRQCLSGAPASSSKVHPASSSVLPMGRPEVSMPPSLESTLGKGGAAGFIEDPLLRWIESREASAVLGVAMPTPAPLMSISSSSQLPAHVQSMEFQWSDIEIVRTLGTGSFGRVYLSKLHSTPVAVKVLVDTRAVMEHLGSTASDAHSATSSTPIGAAAPDKLMEEVVLTSGVRHPNVVNFLGFCTVPPAVAVEYCPRGSLFEVLQNAATDPMAAKLLTWRRRVCMTADAAAGMLHLHSRSPPIVHRDLKSPNLLVAADWTVKVADMGLSKLVSDVTHMSGAAATSGGVAANPRWLAPEVIAGGRSGQAADVFAFGVVMWEMLTWQLPWEGLNTWAVVGAVQQGKRPRVPPVGELRGVAAGDPTVLEYLKLMERCWAQLPAERPGFQEIAQTLRSLQGSTVDVC